VLINSRQVDGHDKSRDNKAIGHRNIFKLRKDNKYNIVEYGVIL
jgi:hypothetical protein